MSSSRRILPKALFLTLLAATVVVSVAAAQFYEPSVRSLGLTSGSLARSPRLLGMGKLELVVDDRDAGLTLWDFAQNPMGIATDDTTSTIDFRPGTDAAHSSHYLLGPARVYREQLAARSTRNQVEAFHRAKNGTVYGAVLELNSVRFDRDYSDAIEVRRGVTAPSVSPVISGGMPFVSGGRVRYALRAQFESERQLEEYRRIIENGAGQFIGLDGLTLDPPNFFDPEEYKVRSSGFGAFVSYDLSKAHVLALGLDAVSQEWQGTNSGFRHTAQTEESRPYKVGQASLVGRFGKALEYGVDGRGWLSSSEQDWRFTISAGVGGDPLVGRGKLLEREEKGSRLDTRAKWHTGAATVSGQLWTTASKVSITPPGPTDPTSLNRFLNQIAVVAGSDTLALPDSVIVGETRSYAYGYGLGLGYRLQRAIVGGEFHWNREVQDRLSYGSGPKQMGWDVRGGVEYRYSDVLTGRAGYLYRAFDDDDYTRQNEYTGHTATIGFGLKPIGTTWTIETAYAFEWLDTDFGDPSETQRSRQNLALQIHWGF